MRNFILTRMGIKGAGDRIDVPRRAVLTDLKAGRASLKARISVGQTKVKSLKKV